MSKRSYESTSASEQGSSPPLCSRSQCIDHQHAHISKSVAIDHSESIMMQCSLPPHTSSVEFATLEAFETHYVKEHTNRCTSCGKNFPSAHFLALHLDEIHNPVREVLAAKGEKTYGCFVEGCEKKCSSPSKRRLHLIDKHEFPRVYNFRIVELGIDRSTSLLREGQKRRVSVSAEPPSRRHRRTASAYKTTHSDQKAQDAEKPDSNASKTLHEDATPVQAIADRAQGTTKISRPNDNIEELETTLSALSFVPRSVRSRQARKASK